MGKKTTIIVKHKTWYAAICMSIAIWSISMCFSLAMAQTSLRAEDYIEKRVSELEDAVWQLKQRYNNIENDNAIPVIKKIENEDSADLFIRVMQLEDTLRSIIGQNEKIQHDMNTLRSKLNIVSKDVDFRFAEIETHISSMQNTKLQESMKKTGNMQAQKSSETVSSEVVESGIDALLRQEKAPEQLFKKSYSFITAQNYIQAEIEMKNFIAQFPNHERVSDATYWLGESYYARDDYRNAATYFLKVYTDYGKTEKAPRSMYKLSLSLIALEQKEQACSVLNAIEVKYQNIQKSFIEEINDVRQKQNC